MQVAERRGSRVHALPVAVHAGIVRHEPVDLHDPLAPGRPGFALARTHHRSRRKAVSAQVLDNVVQVLDPRAELLAVARAQQKRAAPGTERIGRVALRRQRLVHLDDAAQVEGVGHLLELRERQLHERVPPPELLGVELQRALKFFDGFRVH